MTPTRAVVYYDYPLWGGKWWSSLSDAERADPKNDKYDPATHVPKDPSDIPQAATEWTYDVSGGSDRVVVPWT